MKSQERELLEFAINKYRLNSDDYNEMLRNYIGLDKGQKDYESFDCEVEKVYVAKIKGSAFALPFVFYYNALTSSSVSLAIISSSFVGIR